MSDYIITKKSETDTAQIEMCSDGIIRVMLKGKRELNGKAFEAIFALYNDLVKGEPHAYIYYAEDNSVIVTEDGRRFAKDKEYSFPKICNAIVVNNLAHKLLANFYLRFNKPFYPFKVFSKMEEAEKWCLQQILKRK